MKRVLNRRKGSNSLTQTTTGDAAQRAVVTRLQKTVFPNPLTRPCQQSHIHCQTCRGRLALSENKRTPGDDLLAQLSVWARRNGKRSRLSQAVFFFPCISHRGRRSIASEAVTYKDAKPPRPASVYFWVYLSSTELTRLMCEGTKHRSENSKNSTRTLKKVFLSESFWFIFSVSLGGLFLV